MMDVTRLRLAYALCCICVLCANGGFGKESAEYGRFPPDFLFGVATSAYQIEGAWNVDGKAESAWDRFVHENRSRIVDHTTGDDACESYYRTKSDVALLKELGFNAYRFSISWSRILPGGFSNKKNEDGIRYYHELIDELIANGIEPIPTIYHWDHPQILEDAGGWLNSEMVDWFTDYADIVFKEYGDKVKKFITVNEPTLYSIAVYELGTHAPGKKDLHGVGTYRCLHHLLQGHAKAYRLYEKYYKPTQNGSVGINIQFVTFYPKYSNGSSTVYRATEFLPGWALHPIYSKEGDYPKIMKDMIAKKSKEQGFPKSRLPVLSREWIDCIKGSSDFLSVNYYTAHEVEDYPGGEEPSFLNDWDIRISNNLAWQSTAASWQKVSPTGFRDGLRRLAEAYGNPPMIIAENGVATGPELEDISRVQFLYHHISEMLVARNQDGVNIWGYLAWTFMDDFEFNNGYTTPFGIVQVNHTDPKKIRTPKASAAYLARVAKAIKNNEVLPEK